MWIGAHPDDELYLGGTLGYATKDKGIKLTIISFAENPDFLEANRSSAEFLNNAEYLYLTGQGLDCDINEVDEAVSEAVSKGAKDEIIGLIREKKPDVIFTFESSNGYRTICPHIVSAVVAQMAIEESGVESETFSILNRDHLLTSILGGEMDPLPVTDVIDLDEHLWEYRMAIFGFYSPFYPTLVEILETPSLQDELLHQEFFRKVE